MCKSKKKLIVNSEKFKIVQFWNSAQEKSENKVVFIGVADPGKKRRDM
jgi:hypothetical protein